MKIEPKTDTLWKTHLVYILVLLFGIAIIGKIVLMITKDNKEYQKLAEKREYRVRELEASRGNIFSADGNLMATTIPLYDIFFDAKSVDSTIFYSQIDQLCAQLAETFPSKTASQWKEHIIKGKARGNRHNLIARNISLELCRKMEQFPIFNLGKFKGGFIAEKKARRDKPYKELAGCTIGYYINDSLKAGLEGTYNEYLKGQNGHMLVRLLHHGSEIPIDSEDDMDAQNGDDLVTTFDVKLQDIVESALNTTMVNNKAEQGCAILMDVETGYIRAMANLTLNHKTGNYEESTNFALAERYEPGSVFKIASMIVLLNHNPDLKLDDKVNIGSGAIKFSNRTMKDDHSFAKNGICTMQEVIEQSSNKGTAVLITKAFAAHPEKYVDGLYALGLNKKIGTGIAREAQPYIKHPNDKTRDGRKLWSNVSLPWMSIGYEVNVTPLHLITLYNAIANGGRMMKPQFVTEIRRGNQTIEKFEPIVLNEQIASPESIEKIKTMLEGVVIRGTAKRQFKDCVVKAAGKTGTAQYYDRVQGYAYHEPGIGRKLYNTTFVGYFPVDKPKYSCIVVVSRARGPFWAAGSVSAPGFREIAEKVYAMHLGVQEDKHLNDSTIQPAPKPVIMPHDQALAYLNGLNEHFTDYEPKSEWVRMEKMDNEGFELKSACLKPTTVPNVVGMNITDAVYLLESMGIKTSFTGQGQVKEQSLHAGDTLRANSVINLKLERL
jgi:cell division protein FtsI (penicillin-binding protein 3)